MVSHIIIEHTFNINPFRQLTTDFLQNPNSKIKIANVYKRPTRNLVPNILSFFPSLCESNSPSKSNLNSSPWDLLRFPISTVEQMNLLEDSLQKNVNFRQEFAQKFSQTDHPAWSKSNFAFAFAVADELFGRALLAKFSWGGNSTVPRNKKIAFNEYIHVIEGIQDILEMHNKEKYTSSYSLHFLKDQLLRNSKQRYLKEIHRKKMGLLADKSSDQLLTIGENIYDDPQISQQDETVLPITDIKKENISESLVSEKDNINVDLDESNYKKRPFRSVRNFPLSSPTIIKRRRKTRLLVKTRSKSSAKISTKQAIQTKSVPTTTVSSTPPPTKSQLPKTSFQQISTEFNYPLKTTEDLTRLNEVLAVNRTFRSNFITQMSKTNNKRKSKSKFTLAYAVIDAICDKSLLADYTWAFAGYHRKPAFNNFTEVIKAFQEILSSRDKKFTKERTIFFLHKKLFRNSKWRCAKLAKLKMANGNAASENQNEAEEDQSQPEQNDEEEEITLWTNFSFPINSTRELNLLEQTLTERKIFRKNFIETYSSIKYVKNKRLKFDFAFAVADKIFDREIFTKYSWEGYTKTKYKKLPFNGFTEIVRVFYEILSTRNKKYTRSATLYFFKNILLQKGAARFRTHKKSLVNRALKAAKNTENENCQPENDSTGDNDKNVKTPDEKAESVLAIFNFPLKTVEEFNTLEDELGKNAIFRQEFINSFSKIKHHQRHTRSKFDFGFVLADAIFERELLAKYTWRGNSDKHNKKMSFAPYKECISAFCDIMLARSKKNNKSVTLFYMKTALLKYGQRRFDQQIVKQNKSFSENNDDSIESSTSVAEADEENINETETNKTDELEYEDPDDSTPWSELQFPLRTIEELTYMNQLLTTNSVFRREFIDIFTTIKYIENPRTRFDFAFAVTDKIFDKDLLCKYSWTGYNHLNERKYPFKVFTEVIKALYEILYTRHKKYSRAVAFYFFKNVMFRRAHVKKLRSISRVLEHPKIEKSPVKTSNENSKEVLSELSNEIPAKDTPQIPRQTPIEFSTETPIEIKSEPIDDDDIDESNLDLIPMEIETFNDYQMPCSSNQINDEKNYPAGSLSPSIANFESCFHFPINTESDLKSLENLLGVHREFKVYFLNRFSAAEMPHGNGITEYKASYFIAEQLFTFELLSKFSWQIGRMHRQPFNAYKNIVRAFYEIVSSQDPYYTETSNAYFFKKRLLKTSKVRLRKWKRSQPGIKHQMYPLDFKPLTVKNQPESESVNYD